MEKLRLLDLFSGIGGFSLGLERTGGFETVAFCEIEPFPRKVLAKHWPNVPCFKDVRKLTRQDIDGPIDVICGGYPCQPFSTAGQRLGKEDDRHLWPEVNRLLDEFRPTWFIGENVAGHISMGLDDVLSDLEDKGYAARTFVIPACAVDAKHRRDRVWIVAHSTTERHREGRETRNILKANGRQDGQLRGEFSSTGEQSKVVANSPQLQRDGCELNREISETDYGQPRGKGGAISLAHTHNTGLQGRQEARNTGSIRQGSNQHTERCADLPRAIWRSEPDVGRVAHGVPNRSHRLKALGNAVVPQIPEMLGYAILDAIASNN